MITLIKCVEAWQMLILGGRFWLETIAIVQERDDEAQSQVVVVLMEGEGGRVRDLRDSKELGMTRPGP